MNKAVLEAITHRNQCLVPDQVGRSSAFMHVLQEEFIPVTFGALLAGGKENNQFTSELLPLAWPLIINVIVYSCYLGEFPCRQSHLVPLWVSALNSQFPP